MDQQSIFDLIFQKETIFLGLFLYLLWVQQQEKKGQNDFILKQQDILSDLTGSFEKLATNQEKLTGRIELIEVKINTKEVD